MSRYVVGSSSTARELVGRAIDERGDLCFLDGARNRGRAGGIDGAPEVGVRMPAERDVIADRQRKRRLLPLGHDRDAARELASV